MNFNYTDKICEYCEKKATLVTGKHMYPGLEDLYKLNFWICGACDASVGCHPGTITPLGTMATAELKRERNMAHAAFDPIWKSKSKTRHEAYNDLADKLGIYRHNCHIGMFDIAMCRRTVEISKEF